MLLVDVDANLLTQCLLQDCVNLTHPRRRTDDVNVIEKSDPPRPPMPGECARLHRARTLKSKRHMATAFAAAHLPRLFKPFLQKERLLSSLGFGKLGVKSLQLR